MVVRIVHRPVRGALEDRQPFHRRRDRRSGLHAAGTGADHCHALVGDALAVVPLAGVEYRPGEFLEARNIRDGGAIELADRGDQHVCLERCGRAIGFAHRDVPARPRRVPARGGDLRVAGDVAADVVLVGAALQIAPQLVALGKMLRPVMVGREGVGEEMVRRVDAAAGIGVLVPGAADGRILLDDGELDARLAQLDRHAEAGQPSADDHRTEARQHLGRRPGAPGHAARVAVAEAHLLEQQRDVFLRHLLADADAQHLAQ